MTKTNETKAVTVATTKDGATIKSLSIVCKMPEMDIEKAVKFVRIDRKESAMTFLVNWVHVGTVLDRIKKNVDKKDFKASIDSVFGTSFNNNDRAYSMRLGEQDKGTLLEWFSVSGCSLTSPKRIFELYAEKNGDAVVNPPKKKEVKGSADKEEEDTKVDVMTLKQMTSTLAKLVRDADENGELVLADYEAFKTVFDGLTKDMADGVEREEKAKKVAEAKKVA